MKPARERAYRKYVADTDRDPYTNPLRIVCRWYAHRRLGWPTDLATHLGVRRTVRMFDGYATIARSRDRRR